MTDTDETMAAKAKPKTKRPRKMARESKVGVVPETTEAKASPTPTKRNSKADLVLGLLKRPEGATIDQLVAGTGWLPHTTRAALTGIKKNGHVVTSEKLEGQGRVYRVAAA